MTLTSARNILMLSAFIAVSILAFMAVPMVIGASTPAELGHIMKDFMSYLLVGLVISSGLMLFTSRFTGESLRGLMRKDERDIALGRKAYALGFWILLAGAAMMIAHMDGDMLRGMKILALSFVAMFVAIIGLAARDEVGLMRLAGRA